jgi:ATP-dependent protease ClpP protease subunit
MDTSDARKSYATIQQLLDESDHKYDGVRKQLQEEADELQGVQESLIPIFAEIRVEEMEEIERQSRRQVFKEIIADTKQKQSVLDHIFDALSIGLVITAALIIVATIIWVLFIDYVLILE